MKTKEEILKDQVGSYTFDELIDNEPGIITAMDEYAKAFADWIRTEGWNNRNGHDWCRYITIYSDISVKTTEELYQMFENQNK
jgi:hypothetical protein